MFSIKLNSGYEMPIIGLGTWKQTPVTQSEPGKVRNAVEYAIESGYKHVDCAWFYRNENEVGNTISSMIKENKIKREDLFVTSKLWCIFHKPKQVKPALMKTLENLQMNYIDLYLMHFPVASPYAGDEVILPVDSNGKWLTEDTDYVSTWKAMEELQKEGLVRSIGVSNFNEFQLNRILKECSLPPAVNQIEVHPYLSQTKLVDFCKEKGIAVTAYSQFGSPDRPGDHTNVPAVLEDPKLAEIASRLKKTVAQVILRYFIQRDLIVIPKSVTPERIKQNFQVFDFDVSKDDMHAIDDLNKDLRVILWTWYTNHKYFPFKNNYSE